MCVLAGKYKVVGDITMERKVQNNSMFVRLWKSKWYGAVNFIFIYSLLFYTGSRLFLVANILCGDGKRWIAFLIVGLIILGFAE